MPAIFYSMRIPHALAFLFIFRVKQLDWITVHPPFYNQDPSKEENYKKDPRSPVRLPPLLRSGRLNKPFECKSQGSFSTAGRPRTSMKPQKPPPRNSNQDGFEPLKEPWRSLRQQKKRPASASTPTRKHHPSNNSDAGEWTTNAEHAHEGAQKVRPFRKKIDQNIP